MKPVNIKSTKCCAICRYWNDVANEAISPRVPTAGLWKIDEKAKQMCLRKNYERPATACCSNYECKL